MEELIDSICEYIKKPYTDYAIMINGEWGSGKTYFWNNKLRSRLESIKVNGKNYKTIYMSLYGINSLEEISKKIFIETNPMISKTLKKFVDTREGNLIPEYVKTGLDMANLFGSVNLNSDKVDFSKQFSIDDKILCFDDLERANVDVIDILGYINNFVEHDGIKTILICNEKELATKFKNTNVELKTLIATYILDKEGKITNNNDKANIPLGNIIEEKISDIFDRANAYERIKEKLIGETFEYIPEYAYILSGMIMKYSYNDNLSDFYKRNTSVIISTFKKSETRNLRILKHALNDFEKIFNETFKFFPNINYEILRTMLIFTIAVSFEIKAGNVSKERLKEVRDNDEYVSVIFTSKILNDNNQFYLREFDTKYFINDFAKYKFFKFIEIYIRTRFFDEKLFKENINDAANLFISAKDVKEDKSYINILNGDYWKLSDFDFEYLYKQVLDEVKSGKVEFHEYVKLFAIYKYLIDLGLVKMEVSDLKHDFLIGMQLAAINNSGTIIKAKISDADVNYDITDKDISEIKEEYLRVKKSIFEEFLVKNANDLFGNLPQNPLEFYKNIVSEYKEIPVFSRYDMEELYKRLKTTQNYDIYNFINVLESRYDTNKELLEKELPNLLKLANYIDENNELSQKTIKTALLGNISKLIKKHNN